MRQLQVWRISDGESVHVGTINANPTTFTYAASYLQRPDASALSCSLPLREDPYSEPTMQPYFEGLLPEGEARAAAAYASGVSLDDYLSLLEFCGKEVIGDVAITDGRLPVEGSSYEPLEFDVLAGLFVDMAHMSNVNKEARLSLAGVQGKLGLAHEPGRPMDEGWFRPVDGAPTTHVLKTAALDDLPLIEYLCMKAAGKVGISVPEVGLFRFTRPVLWLNRFDREAHCEEGELKVTRLHQEDMAQAFGVSSRGKYSELVPSTAAAITALLRSRSSAPIEDIRQFIRLALFNYLIGNCDNHLKNMSLIYGAQWRGFRFAPAYDLASTTRYEHFSTFMGMAIGGAHDIEDVSVGHWLAFAEEIGVKDDELRAVCASLLERVFPALEATARECEEYPELPWIADALCDEAYERWCVLDELARS